jgi:hypothetical protein
MSDEDYDDSNPYDEMGREDALDNGEIDSAEEGFLKGYEDDQDGSYDVEELDDEALKD